jgi:hypothetical protein
MQELTPEEKALLDDLLLDGEDFCDLVITPEELPIAKSLAEKKYIVLDSSWGEPTASAYKTPLQKWIKFVDDLYYDGAIPTDKLPDEEKAQVLEYLKTKFGL